MPHEVTLEKFEGVPVYARPDSRGRPVQVDAIDLDERKIRSIADHLQHPGYGVKRARSPRAGKIYYTVRATWVEHGDPPAHPLS
jgi:hypothetical protein